MHRLHGIAFFVAVGWCSLPGCKDNEPKPVPPNESAMTAPSPAGASASAARTTPRPPPAAATIEQTKPIVAYNTDIKPATQPAAGKPENGAATAGGTVLSAAGIAFAIPNGWIAETPSNTMRVGQYHIPGDEGGGEAAVFWFGKGQGGSVAANVQRWVGQFSNPDKPGSPVDASNESIEAADGLKVTIVRANGSYAANTMGATTGTKGPQPGYALFALIVEGGPQGSVFVKVTGPATTLKKYAAAMDAMAKNAKKAG